MSESFAWKYFVKCEKEDSAVCNKCKSVLKCKGWSTSGLIRHLSKKHNINKPSDILGKRPAEEEASTSNKRLPVQTKLTFAIRKETCAEIVTKLATLDGISINSITKSQFIRQSLFDKGFCLPKNPSHVMDLVHSQYDNIKDRVCSEITSCLNSGSRFSLSLDEYTSLNNRRYLNINVHRNDGKFWNLGMVKINGSMPAEIAVDSVRTKLEEFGLSLDKHIVSCVTDGASVMVKFGRLIACDHNLCYAHGIHLAVCDVLYRKTDTIVDAMMEETVEQTRRHSDGGDEDEDNDFSMNIDSEVECGGNCDVEIDINLDVNDTDEKINVSAVINKVRKIARLFRKSPLKNEILQKYVTEDHGKNLMMILDTKTRWNSLLAMLERYVEIRSPVSKALIDLKNTDIEIEKEEATVIQNVVSALLPVKTGAEKLGNRDSTLLSSEAVFKFILNELKEQKNSFALLIRNSMIQRIKERRNGNLVGLIKYLHFGK
jgi:hypothetical protein